MRGSPAPNMCTTFVKSVQPDHVISRQWSEFRPKSLRQSIGQLLPVPNQMSFSWELTPLMRY